jgi:hypothetical protein
VPRFSVRTADEPFFRLIVYPGPTVAVSRAGAAELEAASAEARAATTVSKSAIRTISEPPLRVDSEVVEAAGKG